MCHAKHRHSGEPSYVLGNVNNVSKTFTNYWAPFEFRVLVTKQAIKAGNLEQNLLYKCVVLMVLCHAMSNVNCNM